MNKQAPKTTKSPEIIQIKNQKEYNKIRKVQWMRQGKQCAILKEQIEFKDTTMDHKHKLKAQEPGPHGRGLCRGILHNNINSLEGTIVKKYKRFGVHKLIPLPTFLRRLADYLENPPMWDQNILYIHPTEKPKPKTLGKREFNTIIKHWSKLYPKRKPPQYPKSGRKTEKWEKWLNQIKEIQQMKTK